jgi:hypothetical protein
VVRSSESGVALDATGGQDDRTALDFGAAVAVLDHGTGHGAVGREQLANRRVEQPYLWASNDL